MARGAPGRLLGGVRAALGMALSTLILCSTYQSSLWAQFPPSSRFELSDSVYVAEPESAARTHLEQVAAFLASEKWDEAIDILRTVSERHGQTLVRLPPDQRAERSSVPVTQYCNVRDYCQWQLASLPPQALAIYRGRVDAQAEQAYRDALATRVPQRVEQVVKEYFCSTWGDDALLAWGDLALEAGDLSAARRAWQRILREPVLEQSTGTPAVRRLTYPDSQLPSADIAARLILVSILEQDSERAQAELSEFTRLYPAAVGRLGGREVQYAAMLASLLTASRDWPSSVESPDWSTFAGALERTRVVHHEVDVGAVMWRAPLKQLAAEDPTALDMSSRLRFGEERPRRPQWLLSYHPLLVDDLLLVNTQDQILAFERSTGKPAWGGESEVIYREDQDQFAAQSNGRYGSIGSPRFTMTAEGGRLFARMGSPVTIYGNEMQRRGGPGYLVCLDLRAEGRLLWKLLPEFSDDTGQWAFEGSPICNGEYVYVAVRQSGVRPQIHVVCYEAQTGRLRWRRYVCSAETPGSGQKDESTANLLTLDADRLYVNTNLGAVAALDARDGEIEWLTVYRTSQVGDLLHPAAHFRRDLNPCICYRGQLFVAPSDSPGIFAFDAATGELLWESPHAADALQLLGVGGGNLIASGDRLYWINIQSGKLIQRWPDGPAPKGYGRGALVGTQIVWPTREELYLLSQKTGQLEKVIQLAAQHSGHTGGNLLVDARYLFVASSDHLTCYSHYSRPKSTAAPSTQ